MAWAVILILPRMIVITSFSSLAGRYSLRPSRRVRGCHAGAENRDASACSEDPSSGERCRHWAACFGWRWDTTSSDRQEGEPSGQQQCARTANFSESRLGEFQNNPPCTSGE